MFSPGVRAAQRSMATSAVALTAGAGAAVSVTYLLGKERGLHMEGGGRGQTSTSKPPIYSAPPETVYLAEVRGPLEDQVAFARRTVSDATGDARNAVRSQVDKWIGVERSVENRVSNLIAKDEEITPGILYVGIATLSASIFTRYRSLPLRLLAPPLFFFGSLNYFLPRTSHNVGAYYVELESKHLPPFVRQQRLKIAEQLQRTRHTAEQQLDKARSETGSLVQRGLHTVEQNTGLKVGGGGSAASTPADKGPARRIV